MNNTQKWLKRTSGSFPKIVGYFVGNEVLSSWIKAIGYDIERGVKHGGALFIEFFRNETNGTAYIRLFLKEPEDITYKPNTSPLESGRTDIVMTVTAFS